MTRPRTPEPMRAISGLQAAEAGIADRRKLAIAAEILEHGPQTGTRIMAVAGTIGGRIETLMYCSTLRQHGFLARIDGQPVRWDLTDKARAWLAERGTA